MRRIIGTGIFGGLAFLAGTAIPPSPAQAACVLAGGTVTCTGSDDNGFSGGNNLIVRVETGAAVDSVYDGNPDTICPVFRSALRLGQNAQVTNLGQIAGRGNCAIGIEAGSGLTLTNEAMILADSQVSFAILTADRFNVVNRGTFSTTNSESSGFVGGNNGTLSNAATGVIETAGAGSSGIVAENTNAVTNAGRITLLGPGSFGMDLGSSNTVTNSGTITASGVASTGIRLRGLGSVTNSGTITVIPIATPRSGEDSIGVAMEQGGGLVNSGTIAGDFAGVLFGMANGSIQNSGTISARATMAAASPGGAIIYGDRAFSGSTLSVINTGVIRGGGSAAIRPISGTPRFDFTLVNSGRIEGDIILPRGGLNTITLRTGSIITGVIDGRGAGNDFELNGEGTLSTQLLGAFSLAKTGAGTWTLARDYNFISPIDVIQGTLDIAANINVGGTYSIETGGTLGGRNSVIGAINRAPAPFTPEVANFGTISPGLAGPAGATITVIGIYQQGNTGKLVLDLNAGANDALLINGAAQLGGSLDIRYSGAPVRDGQVFTLISAPTGGALTLSGAFAQVGDNSPYFITSTVTSAAGRVSLRATRHPFVSVAQSPEEIGLAQYFDRAVATGANPGGFITLLDQQTESEARATFGSLSSDLPVSAQTWGILGAGSMATATSPWLELAPADSKRGEWRTWGAVSLRGGETGRDAGAGAFDYELRGAVAAADYAVVDGTRLGVLLARQDGETFLAAGAAKSDNSVTSAGVYVSQAWPQWRAGAGYIFGDGRSRMNRLSTIGGATTAQTAHADLDTETAFGQISYSTGTDIWLVKPTAMLTYARGKVAAYAEAAPLGLSVAGQTGASLRGDIGVRAIAKPGPVHVMIGAFWSQNFKDNDRTARASLIGLPGSDFTIAGVSEKRGWLNTQAGVNIEILPGLMARLNWSGILNDRLGGHTASAGLSYRW
jgi:uncharacterized protein with beta-barrel porin domain